MKRLALHLRSMSLPIKVFIGAVVVGMIVWGMVNSFVTHTVREAFETQLTDLLEEKAFQHRVRFSRSVEAYYHAAKLLSSQYPLIEYLHQQGPASGDAMPTVSKGRPPGWLPGFPFLRSFVVPHYVLLLDREGTPLEVYQNWPEPPPAEIIELHDQVLRQSLGQTFIALIADHPYLFAAEEIVDSQAESLGILILATPLDEAFMITSNGPSTDWNLVALIDEKTNRVITSNNQQRIESGIHLSSLQENYIFTEPKFLALGGMELNFRFASLVCKDSIASLTSSVTRKERYSHIMAAMAYMVPVIIVVFWLTRRVLRLTVTVEDFYRQALGYDQEIDQSEGDQLDILEQRFHQLTVDIKERTSQLENANRELEAFAYSVSHDLRAPLRSIDGFSLALEEDYGHLFDETGHDYLQRVRRAAQRMGTLIDAMLMLSKVTRGEMRIRRVDLSGMIHSLAEEFSQSEPERKASFVIEPGVHVIADEGLLRIAMTNLLDNAWKFTSANEQVRIEFGTVREDQHHKPSGMTKPIYFIADNGVGFNMEFADKLFGAFQRLHRDKEFPGTGVGLATVQRIINRHGGRIWTESQVGRGATFFFTLQGDP